MLEPDVGGWMDGWESGLGKPIESLSGNRLFNTAILASLGRFPIGILLIKNVG